MPTLVKIRTATLADCPRLAEFNTKLAFESEGKRLDPAIINPGVRRALSTPALCRYYVAEVDAGQDVKVIGQTMITYEVSDWRDGLIWWIQSVYVDPEFRRSGVFRSLFAHIEREAKLAGDVRAIRLYVEHDNHKAQATYTRLGMSQESYHIFVKPV